MNVLTPNHEAARTNLLFYENYCLQYRTPLISSLQLGKIASSEAKVHPAVPLFYPTLFLPFRKMNLGRCRTKNYVFLPFSFHKLF